MRAGDLWWSQRRHENSLGVPFRVPTNYNTDTITKSRRSRRQTGGLTIEYDTIHTLNQFRQKSDSLLHLIFICSHRENHIINDPETASVRAREKDPGNFCCTFAGQLFSHHLLLPPSSQPPRPRRLFTAFSIPRTHHHKTREPKNHQWGFYHPSKLLPQRAAAKICVKLISTYHNTTITNRLAQSGSIHSCSGLCGRRACKGSIYLLRTPSYCYYQRNVAKTICFCARI